MQLAPPTVVEKNAPYSVDVMCWFRGRDVFIHLVVVQFQMVSFGNLRCQKIWKISMNVNAYYHITLPQMEV